VAEASRNKKTLKDDPDAVDMEEMNPLWLKDKGMYVNNKTVCFS